ncbi:MAG: PorP/SprF family type IX secretion system membrane protein [Bacteroidota bacterium]
MTRFLLLAFILSLCIPLSAQQLPLFTQYGEQVGLVNPAAVSNDFLLYEHNVSFGASYRRQWLGLESAPKTQSIRGEYIFADTEGIGLIAGGHLINDQTGPTGFTGIYGRIAGIFSDDPYDSGISAGFSLGLVQYRVNISDIKFLELNDVLITEDQSQLYPDVGFGVYAYKRLSGGGWLDDSQVYGGISVPQLFGLDLEFKDDNDQFFTRRLQHFYGLLGLIKYLDDGKYIQPSIWVKYVPNVPVNIDFNFRYQLATNFWLGTGASTAGTVHLETGVILGEEAGYGNHFKVAYGFDYSFRTFGPAAGTTHEINLFYSFGNY